MDPYVLRGSCQAIVSLHDDHRGTGYQEFRDGYHNYETRYSEGSQQSSYFWIVILFLGFLFFLYKIFQHFQAQQRVRPQMYASTTPGIPPQYYQTPLGTSNFWSNLGWAGLFGSMFARRYFFFCIISSA